VKAVISLVAVVLPRNSVVSDSFCLTPRWIYQLWGGEREEMRRKGGGTEQRVEQREQRAELRECKGLLLTRLADLLGYADLDDREGELVCIQYLDKQLKGVFSGGFCRCTHSTHHR